MQHPLSFTLHCHCTYYHYTLKDALKSTCALMDKQTDQTCPQPPTDILNTYFKKEHKKQHIMFCKISVYVHLKVLFFLRLKEKKTIGSVSPFVFTLVRHFENYFFISFSRCVAWAKSYRNFFAVPFCGESFYICIIL